MTGTDDFDVVIGTDDPELAAQRARLARLRYQFDLAGGDMTGILKPADTDGLNLAELRSYNAALEKKIATIGEAG